MSPQKESNKWGADIDEVQVLLEKLKKTLASRGPGGIVGLGKQFRVFLLRAFDSYIFRSDC